VPAAVWADIPPDVSEGWPALGLPYEFCSLRLLSLTGIKLPE